MKQITYFDPRVVETDPNGQNITVTATTAEEYAAHMAAITNPERDIPQDSISVIDLPDPEPEPDYTAFLAGLMEGYANG